MDTQFPKYQYSIFGAKGEQFVVRSNDFKEFAQLIGDIVKLVPESAPKQEKVDTLLDEAAANAGQDGQESHFCTIHKKPLKQRIVGPDRSFWDHRAKLNDKMEFDDNGSWYNCQGKGWKLSTFQG